MAQLSLLASEMEKSLTMKWTIFDISVVDEIEKSVSSWQYAPAEDSIHTEDDMQRERDCFHCAEAWRNAILIYIIRVFRWKRTEAPPARLAYLSRTTLDHVQCCRRTLGVQKQVLLPVFLAACETRDEFGRKSALDYCTFWAEKYGYNMFTDASNLLAEVWAEQDNSLGNDVWWGSVVDRKEALRVKMDSDKMQFCFG
jgi:hypothetical protein